MRDRKSLYSTALRDAHEAIEALIHSEQNPSSYKLEKKAGDLVTIARKSRAIVEGK